MWGCASGETRELTNRDLPVSRFFSLCVCVCVRAYVCVRVCVCVVLLTSMRMIHVANVHVGHYWKGSVTCTYCTVYMQYCTYMYIHVQYTQYCSCPKPNSVVSLLCPASFPHLWKHLPPHYTLTGPVGESVCV